VLLRTRGTGAGAAGGSATYTTLAILRSTRLRRTLLSQESGTVVEDFGAKNKDFTPSGVLKGIVIPWRLVFFTLFIVIIFSGVSGKSCDINYCGFMLSTTFGSLSMTISNMSKSLICPVLVTWNLGVGI